MGNVGACIFDVLSGGPFVFRLKTCLELLY